MWGAIIGGAMGLMGANKQAKAQDAATAAQMAGFNQYKPYVDANLSGASGALDGVLATGAYTGPTYAGPNQFQTGTATNMGNIGGNLQNSGYGMMGNTSGFGSNANALFNQYQGMANSAQGDRLATAMDYASANANPLVDAAMRDDRRNLQENTLTGIDLAASGSGNMNSSRAGVAEAVANRAYDDRQADVSAQVIDGLRTQSLGEQRQAFADQGNALVNAGAANNSIENAYNSGMNTANTGYQMGMGAGGALQGYDQAQMNDERVRFEGNRDFASNVYADYKNGMLTQNGPQTANKFAGNYSDPVGAAISGGMMGYNFANTPFKEGEDTTWGQKINQKVGGWFGS